MTTFSPKEHYLKHNAESVKLFRAIHAASWVSTTLDYALSELTWQGATKEELFGARRYINLLMTIHEPDDKTPRRMPAIELRSNEPEQEK